MNWKRFVEILLGGVYGITFSACMPAQPVLAAITACAAVAMAAWFASMDAR